MEENRILKAIKIQSKLVIPIVKELERELGAERAHDIVGRAIAGSYADFKRQEGYEADSHPRSDRESAFPVDREIVDDTDTSFGIDITECQFAEYFRSIGEPEIGALMTCGVDFAAEELVRPGWDFKRTQTQMQGAHHCDFRWRKRA